jgi:hypothetical protein
MCWTLTHFSHGSFRQQSSIQAVANPVVNGSDQSCNRTPLTLIDVQNYESRICASVDENDIRTKAFQIMILCWRLRAWDKTFRWWTGGKVYPSHITNILANHYSPRGPRAVLYLTTVHRDCPSEVRGSYFLPLHYIIFQIKNIWSIWIAWKCRKHSNESKSCAICIAMNAIWWLYNCSLSFLKATI